MKTHGMRHTPENQCWRDMLQRCRNVRCRAYKYYGARGIKVCERWYKFSNFIADMGTRPSARHTLERTNIDGNYCQENCYWATWTTQSRNKHNNRFLEFDGTVLCEADWCKRLGVRKGTISTRLSRGWSIEEALSTPSQRPIKKVIQ